MTLLRLSPATAGAVIVMDGIVNSTLLALLVLPVLYHSLESRGRPG